MKSLKSTRLCKLPTPGNIAGRSSSITNAFFNAIIPIHEPTEEDARTALRILEIDPENILCAYCGEKATEWDHFRPIIRDKHLTGHITEIANLVPAFGKCNQSKGGYDWEAWMTGNARLSPRTRGVADIDERVERLKQFAVWRIPTRVDITNCVPTEIWKEHMDNLAKVQQLLTESQALAKQIRKSIDEGTKRFEDEGVDGVAANS
jgi:5-methylcytosine-specific restriction endonuclease McrA